MSESPSRVPGAPPLPDIGLLSREYDVLRELGRGGMGTVVLARHRMATHEVAIKISNDGVVASADAFARLTREGKLLASLRHPNIVRLYDVSDIGRGRYGIVMEYVRGVSLARIIAEVGGLPFDRCRSILWDVCAALTHAHSRGIVHRDVKPQNVIIRSDSWVAKLCDFGIARGGSDDAEVTASGFVAGTPGYMAPEHIDGKTLDGRSDLYSLGVLGWEMLTGAQPWRGMPLFDILYHQKHTELPDLGSRRPGTPPSIIYALEGALSKVRRLRWNNAAEMIAQLELDEPTERLLAIREARRQYAEGVQGLVDSDEAAVEKSQTSSPDTLLESGTPARERPSVVREHDTSEILLERSAREREAQERRHAPLTDEARRALREKRERLLRQLRMRRNARAAALILVGALAGTGGTLSLLRSTSARSPIARYGAPLAPLDRATKRRLLATTDGSESGASAERVRANPLQVADSVVAADSLPTPMPYVAAMRGPDVEGPSGNGSPPRMASGEVENPERALYDETVQRSQRLLSQRAYAEAEAVVDSALAEFPHKGALYAVRAHIRASRKKFRDALSDIETATREGGKWNVLALDMRLRLESEGRDAARASLSRDVQAVFEGEPHMIEADRAFGLARALVVVGDTATALAVLAQTTAPDPTAAPRFDDAALAPLARDPRFLDIRRRVLGAR